MIQFYKPTTIDYYPTIRANIYNDMTSTDYLPLISFESQFTGKIKNFRPNMVVLSNLERYYGLTVKMLVGDAAENLVDGRVNFGNKNFPFGFYNVTIYENNNNTNLDPTNAIKTLWTGLANISTDTTQATTPTVKYTEYTDNDSDTESIYLTNPL